MFSSQLLCNISEAIFPLVQCGCAQRKWTVPKQRGSPLFCSCVLAWCSLARTETFVTPRPCDSLNFCSSNFNWTAAFLHSGKVPCSSAFRAHGFSVSSCSLSLVRDRDMSSVPWIGWNLNHCFVSLANLTNNAEHSASSETDCRPSGQQIPSCFLSRSIRYVTKIAVGWMWRRVIWLPLFCKSPLHPSSGCRRRCWERFILTNRCCGVYLTKTKKFWNIFFVNPN